MGNPKRLRYLSRREKRIKQRKEKKGVVLLSGGVDSTVTLYFAKRYGYKINILIFDYNQRHRREIEAAKRIAQLNNVKYCIVRMNIGWAKSSLTNRRVKVPFNRDLKKRDIPPTYVAGRNIIFLSYAASYAESVRANKIFIGAHIQDYSGYPDCRPEFLHSFQKAINVGMKNKDIEIIAPLINKSKKEIIELGMRLKVPFQYTWSCYKGNKLPCRKCDSCRFRMKAFADLGLVDPLLSNNGESKSFRSL
jgi:7-cyano-7-deazaguanine synthase